MKKFLKGIAASLWVIVGGFIGYVGGCGLSEMLSEAYKNTGGMVMAKDLVEFQTMPYIFGILGAAFVVWLYQKK